MTEDEMKAQARRITCMTARCKSAIAVLVFVLAAMAGTKAATAQNSKSTWMTGPRAEAFWNFMSYSPYAQTGNRGLVVYMISYSRCANCMAFLRSFWGPHKADMQLREIFAPIAQPELLNEAADIALTRSAANAQAYYDQTRTAPPANSSPDREAALNTAEAFMTRANQFFSQLGHIQNGFPTFIVMTKDASGRDKLWIISGWGDLGLTNDFDTWVLDALK